MSEQVITSFLIKLQDDVSKNLEATARSADALEKGFEDLRKEQKKGGKEDKKREVSLASVGAALGATAAVAAVFTAAMAGMGGAAISTSSNLEAFETRLGGMLGGLDQGKARVAELFELSAKTPFSINGLVEAEATLEAFGVNATRVRGGVMDLAGAMGMDLNDAATAVGKALAGGAGAAEVLRDKGVLAAVEIQAGMSTAEMTTEQFREALIGTLETNERIAGGTERMSQTFTGMMSTLGDQWTVFSKQVGDAQLFSTAKATLSVVLERLGENTEETKSLATVVGGFLAKSLLTVVDLVLKSVIMVNRFRLGWETTKQVIYAARIAIKEVDLAIYEMLANLPMIGEGFAQMAVDQAKSIAKLQGEFAATADTVDELRATEEKLVKFGADMVEDITTVADEFQRAAHASKDIKQPKSDDIMVMVGIDKKQAKLDAAAAKKTAKELEKFQKGLLGLSKGFTKSAEATRKPLKESQKMQLVLQKMADDYGNASKKAAEMGPAAQAAFDQVKGSMLNSMSELAAAIPKQSRKETAGKIGAGLDVGVGAMSDGGMGLLSSAGPYGAAAAGLIGMGQEGGAAVDEEVEKLAEEAAEDRAEGMEAEAEKMKEKGYSEAEIEAAGLGAEDIALAGEVTDADRDTARAGVDEDQIMADHIAQGVQGVIDGIINIAHALPEILSTLIPLFLTELPNAIIEMIPVLIEELIPVLLTELPKTLFKMLFETFPKLVKMLLLDLPASIFRALFQWWGKVWTAIKKFFKKVLSFGIMQTGGFVPQTGMTLLHQGERVIPATGAGTQTATRGLAAFGGMQGPSLTVNTNVVSPDSIPELGRMIDNQLGAHGRTNFPIFGSQDAITEI